MTTQEINDLSKKMIPLVYHLSRNYNNVYKDIPYEDFVSEGLYAITICIPLWDEGKGKTLASWCTTSIINIFRNYIKSTRLLSCVPVEKIESIHDMVDSEDDPFLKDIPYMDRVSVLDTVYNYCNDTLDFAIIQKKLEGLSVKEIAKELKIDNHIVSYKFKKIKKRCLMHTPLDDI